MNLNYLSSAVLTAVLALMLPPHAMPQGPRNVEGELLIKWRGGPDSDAAAEGNRKVGSLVKRNFNTLGWQLVSLPRDMDVLSAMEVYRAMGSVMAVEADGVMETHAPGSALPELSSPDPGGYANSRAALASPSSTPGVIPNDPRFNQQWHLVKIGATNAWAETTGSTDIVVALIDTGVDYTHPDLAANMWRNPGERGIDAQGQDKSTNGVDDDNNGYVDDLHGVDTINENGNPTDSDTAGYHGTAMAGNIGAVGNNGVGISGVNWAVQIMAIRSQGFLSDLLAGWDYVIMMKRRGVNIRVTSNSYGYPVHNRAWRDAVALAGAEGILHVAAASNFSLNEDLFSYFPGTINLSSVITVTSSSQSDFLAADADFGKSTIHLAAPGVNILTTTKGGYNLHSGASEACSVVAGAAALLFSSDPKLTADNVKSALLASVDQPNSLRGKVITSGRLNVARALEYLKEPNPPAIVIAALPAGQRGSSDATIQATFNRAMNRTSVEAAFSVEPPVFGTFEWQPNNRSFAFRPVTPLDTSTGYTVKILAQAEDESGGTLDGNFNHERQGSPTDDFTWTFRFPVANDDFEKAIRLQGVSGSVQGTTLYSTWEWDEPRDPLVYYYRGSVWYRWSPPEPGWVTFDLTAGTSFDSLLEVYTGESLSRLTMIAGNDNYGTAKTSRLSFPASGGTEYYITVAGRDPRSPGLTLEGPFKLTWQPTPPPRLTGREFSPADGLPGRQVIFTGLNLAGTTAVLFNGEAASFSNASADNLDFGLTAIVPIAARSGPITIVTPHGNITSTASFRVSPPPLRINPSSGNQVIVSWLSTSPEFILESTDEIGRAPWVVMTKSVTLSSDGSSVALPLGAQRSFLRLRTMGLAGP